MDVAEVEESLFAASDAKLHRDMCRVLSAVVCKVLEIFPELEAARPRSKSGIQALCSLHIALEKAKNLLQHCSSCSKLYLAITGDSIRLKFEKTKFSLEESLRRVEGIVPDAIGCQIAEIVNELEGTVFSLDSLEKQVGDDVIALLQQDRKINSNSNDNYELEIFHQAASRLGITSSRAALTERRALKKLIDRARAEEDKRKESIVAYLLHLMRKYSKLFRSDFSDDNDSQGSAPCSPTVQGSSDEFSGSGVNGQAFDRQFSKLSSFNFKPGNRISGQMSVPPEELRCPISLQLMYDPVIISSGQTYERVCIEKWFSDGHTTCPKTQQKLPHLSLTPNYCVKGLIAGWCEQNGIPVPNLPPDSLDLNYWRLAMSESESTNSRSIGSIDSCKVKGVKVVPMEEGTIEEHQLFEMEDISGQECEVDMFQRYKNLLDTLTKGEDITRKCQVVEQIRLLLKDDEEGRIFVGANGFVEALVQFLNSAVYEGHEKAQEVGAMALFNLAVNNDRNKEMILSAGVIPLLEEMIVNKNTHEPATALFLNLSCLEEAKYVIGSSQAVPFLVQLLQHNSSTLCKDDALHTLYNLSTVMPNIPSLLSAGIIDGLQALLASPIAKWAERAISVLNNIAIDKCGKEGIIEAPGLVTGIAAILDTGEPIEQEQAVCCLYSLCHEDENCIEMVLQEGVIPSLVSISVNGTTRGKERAQKLLMLFREQRQRDPLPVQTQQPDGTSDPPGVSDPPQPAATEPKPLGKSRTSSRSRKIGRGFSSMWKSKNFSVH